MKKIQSWIILKFSSARLKANNYKIDITVEEAKKNLETVRVSDSEMLRKLRNLTGKSISQTELNLLFKQQKELHQRGKIREYKKVTEEINHYLFIPQIINVVFSHNSHYKQIIKKGLYINGIKYVRFISSAGQARKSTVMFIDEGLLDPMMEFLECGRNKEYELNESKFNAYISLASSQTLQVRQPNFVVVSDLEIKRKLKVDFVSEPKCEICDPEIDEKEIELPVSVFDGQGLISPGMGWNWSYDLGLDWLPSAFIMRAAWIKGLLVVFDFHEFAHKNNLHYITDIYGSQHAIHDIDVILTESQFKMAGGYISLEDYLIKTKQQGFGWGISRFSPKRDKNVSNLTYQYLQILDGLQDEDIEELCKDTLNWFSDIGKDDYLKTILFLTGDVFTNGFDKNKFDSLEPFVKSLIIKPEMLEDRYVRSKILGMINKKIKESYIGILKVPGNYQFMISDPYALAQHSLGLEVTGLLGYGKFYSEYWNKKEINKVSSLRSPLTWKIENKVLELDKNENLEYWYQYLYSGIVYNIYDNSALMQAGADFDGDITMTTSNAQMVNNAYCGNPVVYERKTAPKTKIEYDNLWKSDIRTFGSKIGFITNLGTSYYSMLEGANEEDKDLIINRLRISNSFQNMQIDKGKGIQVMDIPLHWTKWMSDRNVGNGEKVLTKKNNSLLVNKRPYFMRHIYRDYNRRYAKEREGYNNVCLSRFGITLDELEQKESFSEEERSFINYYLDSSYFLLYNGTMNKICRYMEKNVSELKWSIRNTSKEVYKNLYFNNWKPDKDLLSYMDGLWTEYKTAKKSAFIKSDFQSVDEYFEFLKVRVITDTLLSESEIGNLAIFYGYEHRKQAVNFVWSLFGEYIYQNILKNSDRHIAIPVLDEEGNLEYLWDRFSLREIVL